MGIKQYKPTSPGRRGATGYTFDEITRSKPEKSLTFGKKQNAGRNNRGRISVRHRGGGHKRRLRIIDFKRDKHGIPAKVASVEYDPNRTARIALLHYVDGEKRYIIWPVGLKVGDTVVSGPDAEIKTGNALPLRNLPSGTIVHNLALHKGEGAQPVPRPGGRAPRWVCGPCGVEGKRVGQPGVYATRYVAPANARSSRLRAIPVDPVSTGSRALAWRDAL